MDRVRIPYPTERTFRTRGYGEHLQHSGIRRSHGAVLPEPRHEWPLIRAMSPAGRRHVRLRRSCSAAFRYKRGSRSDLSYERWLQLRQPGCLNPSGAKRRLQSALRAWFDPHCHRRPCRCGLPGSRMCRIHTAAITPTRFRCIAGRCRQRICVS